MARKMPTKKEQEKVKKWFKTWQTKLFLTHWTVEVMFSLTSDPTGGEDTTLISCVPDLTYHILYVTVWQDFWGEPEDIQEERCVHELVHCATSPIGELAARAVKRKQAIRKDVDNTEEQLTQWMTKVIFNLVK